MSDEKSRGATSAHRASAKPGGPAGRSWAAGGAGAAGRAEKADGTDAAGPAGGSEGPAASGESGRPSALPWSLLGKRLANWIAGVVTPRSVGVAASIVAILTVLGVAIALVIASGRPEPDREPQPRQPLSREDSISPSYLLLPDGRFHPPAGYFRAYPPMESWPSQDVDHYFVDPKPIAAAKLREKNEAMLDGIFEDVP